MELEYPLADGEMRLRNLVPSEVSAEYLGWMSNPEVNAYLEVRFNPPRSTNDLENYVANANSSEHTLLAGIFLNTPENHIGNIKLGPIDWNHMAGDLGFLIGQSKYWGKGYASRAIALLTDYAFDQLSLKKITAGCYEDNHGSRRALVKAGFSVEGRIRSQVQLRGVRQDCILMGCVKKNVRV